MVAKHIWNGWGQRWLMSLCAIALVLTLAGCGEYSPTPSTSAPSISETPAPPSSAQPPDLTSPESAMELPAQVETAVLAAAGEFAQVEPSQLAIAEATPQDWPDSCLGLGNADEICAAVLVPGWAITVSDGQQTWKFRTDEEGSIIRRDES